MAGPDGDEAAAARRLEIFLDRVLADTASSSYLLHPSYESVLSDRERALAAALRRFPQELGLKEGNPYGGADVSTFVAKTKGRMVFEDCLGVCRFCTRTELELVTNAVNAATGWDMDVDEAMNVGRRTVNVLRAFNIRHGIGPDVERPSDRYGSVPVDGPNKGKAIGPEWDGMLDNYYQLMGWDRATGKPLPETLKKYGLEQQLNDLW